MEPRPARQSPLTGSSGFEFKSKGGHWSASPAKSVVGPSLRRRPSSLIHCDIWYYSFDKNAEASAVILARSEAGRFCHWRTIMEVRGLEAKLAAWRS